MIAVRAGHKYQTRNGRIVTIHAIADGGLNDKGEQLPPVAKGVLQGDSAYDWSISGAFKNGNGGVPNALDLEREAGVA